MKIPLFYVLFGQAVSLVSNSSLARQTDIVRDAFRRYIPELEIEHAGVRAVPDRDDIFRQCPIRIPEWTEKYHEPGTLTVGVCNAAFAFGLANLPWDRVPLYTRDSITLWYRVLPGSDHPWYGKGKSILMHEIGHRLGLYHPYQGQCLSDESYSDKCADTPRMVTNAKGKCTPALAKSVRCPGQPLPDVHNYMVATEDDCQKRFTPCQVARMRDALAKYPIGVQGPRDADPEAMCRAPLGGIFEEDTSCA